MSSSRKREVPQLPAVMIGRLSSARPFAARPQPRTSAIGALITALIGMDHSILRASSGSMIGMPSRMG